MRILFTILCLFVLPIHFSLAQINLNLGTGSLDIRLEPQYPNPGESVTATIDDYSLNNTGATITWFFDGLSAPAISNNRSIKFNAGEVGQTMVILARLTFPDGRIVESKKTIKPLYLDVIIEPQTFTPTFYKGRALPVRSSIVNINALLLDQNGPVDTSLYNYNWTLNNKSVYGGVRPGNFH
jgi:hypothetical protein